MKTRIKKNIKTIASFFALAVALFSYDAKAVLTLPSSTHTEAVKVTNIVSSVVSTNPVALTVVVSTNLVPLTNAWIGLDFWTGARFASPYTISSTTKKLSATGKNIDGYLEIDVNNRYVLRHGPDADKLESDTNLSGTWYFAWHPSGKYRLPWHSSTNGVGWQFPAPDFNVALGYVFGQSSGPSNFTASTIIGSSDIYLDFTAGLPLFRYCADPNGGMKSQISLEISDSFVTDKQFIELHNTFFVGAGLQVGFLTGGKQAYLFCQGGYADISQPVLVGGTSTVQFNGLDEPEFYHKWVPAMGATIVFPITQAVNVNAGIDAYFSHQPANWEANLGVSFDISKLAGALQ